MRGVVWCGVVCGQGVALGLSMAFDLSLCLVLKKVSLIRKQCCHGLLCSLPCGRGVFACFKWVFGMELWICVGGNLNRLVAGTNSLFQCIQVGVLLCQN